MALTCLLATTWAPTWTAAQDAPPQPLAEERAALQAVWPGALGLSASAEWYRKLKQRHSAQNLLSSPELQRLLQEWRLKRDEQLADALAQWKRDLRAAPNAVAVDTVLARALPLPGDRESVAGQALGEAAQLRLVELQPGLGATTVAAAPTSPAATAAADPASGSPGEPAVVSPASAASAAAPPSVDSVVAALSSPPRGLRVTPRQNGAAAATGPSASPTAPALATPVVALASPAAQPIPSAAPTSAPPAAPSADAEPDENDMREAVQARLDALAREVDSRRQACWQGRRRNDPGAWLLCEGSTDPASSPGGGLRVMRLAKLGCRPAPAAGSLRCGYAVQLAGPVPPPAAPLLSALTGRDGRAEALFERLGDRWTARFDSP